MNDTQKLSVIISAYDQHDVTVKHVEYCMKATRMPDEIIVVNDGGTPDLREKLLALEIKTKLIYALVLENIPWNYTGARNLGLWLSSGNIIASEDTDHIPHPTFYESGLKVFEECPECMRVLSNNRHVISKQDILTKPMEEWITVSKRGPHQDVSLLRREALLRIKGYDERFAGEYAWSCTGLRRRMGKAGILQTTQNKGMYYVAYDAGTEGFKWSKSYRNYHYANEDIVQSPKGILNFTYTYEILR